MIYTENKNTLKVPLKEQENLKELFRLLEQNGMEQEKKQVVQMAEYIDTMEENIVKNLLIIDKMMLGAKAPNYDAYGLFRAAHSHNPAQYSHIVGYISHFYAHIGAGPKVLHPPMSKLMWV